MPKGRPLSPEQMCSGSRPRIKARRRISVRQMHMLTSHCLLEIVVSHGSGVRGRGNPASRPPHCAQSSDNLTPATTCARLAWRPPVSGALCGEWPPVGGDVARKGLAAMWGEGEPQLAADGTGCPGTGRQLLGTDRTRRLGPLMADRPDYN